MKIETKYLGDTEITDSKIIQFSSGLPGFIDETKFVLLDLPDNTAFQILQSVDTPSIAFIVTNPYLFYQNYTIDLDDGIIANLQIENDKDVVVLVIVTVKDPFNTSTINLKAPIIINSQTKRGKQYILNMDDYPSKAAIAPSTSSAGKGE
ncbi:flagellar assembly protein FliW [Virgibacillus sp. JSM 102003]|uniref:flagellar assembly protein FliW n=1 Tax=Virgibacillus sp. JSM 102003 TaxID=1562108 RepID=UPI0035C01565